MASQRSKPSPKHQNSTSSSKRRVPSSPTVHRAKRTTYTRKRPTDETTKPAKYVKGLKTRERVDLVLYELNEKHRWSIKDLIYHLVTAEPTKKYGMTCSARAKALSDAIYKREEVVEQLSRASEDIRTVGNANLIARMRTELNAVGKPEVGLGEFESEKDIAELDIPALAERVQRAAPELWGLLAGLMEQQHASRRDTLTEYQGSMVMVCSILAHARSPRKCNNLPMLLGLHLHSMGVKRRTISVLAGLGITSNYRAINSRHGELAEIGKVPLLSRT
jgi:hypothetical protein